MTPLTNFKFHKILKYIWNYFYYYAIIILCDNVARISFIYHYIFVYNYLYLIVLLFMTYIFI